MRDFVRMVTALSAFLVALPALAQVYKWVDENGVTNYSSKLPANVGAGTKLHTVAEKITVYTPDKALVQAMQAMQAPTRKTDAVLSEKIDRLERQLEAERRARQYAAAIQTSAAQAAYEQCLAARRVDCDSYDAYMPYRPAVFVSSRGRQMPFVPIVPVTGVTAGNVAAAIANAGGTVNFTPGAATGNAIAFRSIRSASLSRGFLSR